MARTLIIFYSRTGNTRKVAETIGAELDADIEQIRDARPRKGLFRGWWRSISEVRKGLEAEILPVRKNMKDYDLVILGTPVWASCMSSPLRTYLARSKAEIRDIAVFVTEGANGGLAVIDQIAALVGKQPVASLIVRVSDLKSGAFRKASADFVKSLGTRAQNDSVLANGAATRSNGSVQPVHR